MMTVALILGTAAAAWSAPKPPSAMPGAAVAVTGSSAPPAPLTPDQLKALDSGLAEAEGIVLDLESIASGGVDGTGCPPSFTVRDYMLDLRARRGSKETGDDIMDSDASHKEDAGPKLDWQFYYVCEALATRNPASCAEASSVTPKTLHRDVTYREGLQDPNAISEDQALKLQQSQSYEGKCVNSFYQERARAAYLSKASNFLDVCRDALPRMTQPKDDAGSVAICKAWRDYNGNPEPFIAALQAGLAHPLKRAFALDIVREMTVAPGACAALPREYYRRMCREQEDFRKALEGRNKDLCRTGICRVLMGDGQAACEAYGKKFRAAACTQRYAVSFLDSRAGSFKAITEQLDKAMAASDAGIGDPKALKAFNARLDKLYDLRDRFTRASEKINPGSTRKTPAAAPRKGT
jgi:hypothetical protein